MHCPNCGTLAVAEQKFCRSCGLELQAISQFVAQQLAGKTVMPPGLNRAERGARMARFLFLGISSLFGGAIMLALEKRYDFPALNLFGLLCVLGGTLLALYGSLESLLFPAQTKPQLPQPVENFVADTTSKLIAATEPAASVIEHTTRSLEPVAAKRSEPS